MPEFSLDTIVDLLKEADRNNIVVVHTHAGLVIKYPKGQKPDPVFIGRLQANKASLCEYLRINPGERTLIAPFIHHDGNKYYELGATQYYWIDDSIDFEFKKRLFGLMKYRISGSFDVTAFTAAVQFVIERHESLRACFSLVNGKYHMRVKEADDPIFAVQYRNMGEEAYDQNDLDEAVCFSGHQFNVQEGPLFITRLFKTGDDSYVVSMKLHHAIFDAWSIDVLLRDLLKAYDAFAKGLSPQMPPLPVQYKELMHLLNRQVEAGYDADRQYWSSQCRSVPHVLAIPGCKETPPHNRDTAVCKKNSFTLSAKSLDRLNTISKKYAVSLFVVLQAFVKFYLYRLTGRNDIVLGTEVFGRDIMEGAENQIGFYSKMRFVRTIFDSDHDIVKALLQVKKSNEDMQRYVACPLLDFLATTLSPGEGVFNTFCNITVNYIDNNGFLFNTKDFDAINDRLLNITPYETGEEEIPCIKWDIDIRFSRQAEKMEGALIYNTEIFEPPAIQNLVNGLVHFIETQAKLFPVN